MIEINLIPGTGKKARKGSGGGAKLDLGASFANLKANSWLTLDGAGGNTTEVLSGETYSPLSTATPHQIWSAAMVISPLLCTLCSMLGRSSPQRRSRVVP